MSFKAWLNLTVATVVIIFFANASVYVVPVHQHAIVTQFGNIVNTQIEPGLQFKTPLVQEVTFIDNRLRDWDGEPSDLLTVDKENIEVNTWARWRVTAPRIFFEALRTETQGQSVLDGLVDASVKNVISAETLMETLRATNRRLRYTAEELEKAEAGKAISIATGRDKIVGKILSETSKETKTLYGFEVEGLGIKRMNYVRAVIPKIYERMRSERIRIANRYESEGREQEGEILGQMTKDLESIESEGYAQAARIRGQADALVLITYANAYNKDPEFYSFSRSLELYPKTLGNNSRLVLDGKTNEFLKYMRASED
jgi:modulator of FtsH protease HflC